MRAIILAAGRGSRMKSRTETLPKCMLELQGKPLINYQLNALRTAGIKQIGVVVGYLKEKIKAPEIDVRFENTRWFETNMVRSLLSASTWLNEEVCIVSYGDIFYSSSAVSALMESPADIAITYDVNFKKLWSSRFESPLTDLETFKFNSNHRLIEIGSRPDSYDDVQGQYMGLLKFTPVGWKKILDILSAMSDDQIDRLDMTSLLARCLQHKVNIAAVPYTEKWGEVDHETDLALYENHVSSI